MIQRSALTLGEQQQRLREDVVLQAVNSLLAEKGYDLMTVDEVAATVGGEAITKQHLVDRLLMQYGPRSPQQLISENLIDQEAKKAGE